MASRIPETFLPFLPPIFAATSQEGDPHGQLLSEEMRMQLNALLFPREGYRYLIRKLLHIAGLRSLSLRSI